MELGRAEDLRQRLQQAGEDEASRLVNSSDGQVPVLCVSLWGSCAEAFDVLMQHSPDLGVVDAKGDSPLHYAAVGHDAIGPQCVRCLLERGADPLAANQHGHTPLWVAASQGRAKALRQLLQDPRCLGLLHQADREGLTPLAACVEGAGPLDQAGGVARLLTVRMLIQAGADAFGEGGSGVGRLSPSLPSCACTLETEALSDWTGLDGVQGNKSAVGLALLKNDPDLLEALGVARTLSRPPQPRTEGEEALAQACEAGDARQVGTQTQSQEMRREQRGHRTRYSFDMNPTSLHSIRR